MTMTNQRTEYSDIVVVGSGNAGFSAASAAKEHSPHLRVLLLEKAPQSWAGGNSTFTAGAYRTVFHGLDDVLPLVSNVSLDLAERIDMQPYSEDDFLNDLQRVTDRRCDPDLAKVLVSSSRETTKWLHDSIGINFQLSFNRQAYEINNRFKFWGGMVLSVVDGGKGLTRNHRDNAKRKGIEVRYKNPVTSLLQTSSGKIEGVTALNCQGEEYTVLSPTVILCAGGFESSQSLRAKYLGGNWFRAYVRGTPHNTGEVLEMAIEAGAATSKDWSGAGCHSTCWDANAPSAQGDQALTNQFTKSGYPLGLMINVNGERFVDEGMDMRNYTYAKFGREILRQPDSVVFQIWDAQGAKWLRKEEYADDVVEKITAETIEELAQKLSGEDRGSRKPEQFVKTIREYNDAVAAHRAGNPSIIEKEAFDPSRKDGLGTRGLKLEKSNWALSLTVPPFLAVKVTCGITFTFGGLKIDPRTAGVLSEKDGGEKVIPGLYCAGEMVGGLFFKNYPGGSGLTSGAVFGRIAGVEAAKRAVEVKAKHLVDTNGRAED
jgi:precorrin 3B synthase CobZ